MNFSIEAKVSGIQIPPETRIKFCLSDSEGRVVVFESISVQYSNIVDTYDRNEDLRRKRDFCTLLSECASRFNKNIQPYLKEGGK